MLIIRSKHNHIFNYNSINEAPRFFVYLYKMSVMRLRCSILLFVLFYSLMNGQDFKIMTYNIRMDTESDGSNAWSKRKDILLEQLRRYKPEIIGFQEVTPGQLDFLADNLENYAYVGKGREENNLGESSNIFYDKIKFNVLDAATFWLSDTPDQVSKGWDAACNRVCTYALLQDKITLSTFYVFNTHLDHKGEMAKTKALELIIQQIKARNIKKYPVFLIGDFNSEPNTERIRWLSKMMIYTRTIALKPNYGPKSTFNAFIYDNPILKEIDYIFMSQDQKFEVLDYSIIMESKENRYPSDHFPVMITVKPKVY